MKLVAVIVLCDTERTIEDNMVVSKGREGQYSKSKATKSMR